MVVQLSDKAYQELNLVRNELKMEQERHTHLCEDNIWFEGYIGNIQVAAARSTERLQDLQGRRATGEPLARPFSLRPAVSTQVQLASWISQTHPLLLQDFPS